MQDIFMFENIVYGEVVVTSHNKLPMDMVIVSEDVYCYHKSALFISVLALIQQTTLTCLIHLHT